MKWIDYIIECILNAFGAVGAGGTMPRYMHSVGREYNSTDAVVGGIGMMVVIAIFAICVLLGRHLWKKHHPPEKYRGYMKQQNQSDSADNLPYEVPNNLKKTDLRTTYRGYMKNNSQHTTASNSTSQSEHTSKNGSTPKK